jgi:hypothetical protein
MAQELKSRLANEMLDVALRAGKKIVQANDLMTSRHQPIAQMRAEKARTARDENRLAAQHTRTPLAAV